MCQIHSFRAFLKKKNVNITVQTYLIDALGAMAFGLFASLLIGTIFATIGEKSGIEVFTTIADYAKSATGAALGIAIAYALKAPQLVLFSAATVGIAGNALGGRSWESWSLRRPGWTSSSPPASRSSPVCWWPSS